ncbi:MAG: HEAT repeat domain-containing protein [Candidatus Hodarchaeota archaeon]
MGKERDFRLDPNYNPYRVKKTTPASKETVIDFDTRRICPACGLDIKISHNFCKRCGVDLSAIEPIGNDEISKQLAITAITDPDPEVRKEAVDTLGDFGDNKVLGVLTYVLLNDPDENVRKEAADELGDLHHPYSLEVFTKALKDESALVRKEAIEGLKKIKKKIKTEKLDEGKPESRSAEEEKPKPGEKTEESAEEKTEESNNNLI